MKKSLNTRSLIKTSFLFSLQNFTVFLKLSLAPILLATLGFASLGMGLMPSLAFHIISFGAYFYTLMKTLQYVLGDTFPGAAAISFRKLYRKVMITWVKIYFVSMPLLIFGIVLTMAVLAGLSTFDARILPPNAGFFMNYCLGIMLLGTLPNLTFMNGFEAVFAVGQKIIMDYPTRVALLAGIFCTLPLLLYSLRLPMAICDAVAGESGHIRRAWSLTRGYTWRLFKFFAGFIVCSVLIAGVLHFPYSKIADKTGAIVLEGLVFVAPGLLKLKPAPEANDWDPESPAPAMSQSQEPAAEEMDVLYDTNETAPKRAVDLESEAQMSPGQEQQPVLHSKAITVDLRNGLAGLLYAVSSFFAMFVFNVAYARIYLDIRAAQPSEKLAEK